MDAADHSLTSTGFVRAMTIAEEDLEIIQAIVNLAGVLGMEVVAEGAETAVEVECLKDLGCHFVQGYFFAPPMPAHEVTKKLEELAGTARSPLVGEKAFAVPEIVTGLDEKCDCGSGKPYQRCCGLN